MAQKVLRLDIDTRQCLDQEEELDILVQALESKGIENARVLLYVGINGAKEKIRKLLQTGIATGSSKMTFALTVEEMIKGLEHEESSVLDYAIMQDHPTVIAYEPTLLQNHVDHDNRMPHEYVPVDGHTFRDALIAIVTLKTGHQ